MASVLYEFAGSWEYITDIFGCSSEFWNPVEYLSIGWMLHHLRENGPFAIPS